MKPEVMGSSAPAVTSAVRILDAISTFRKAPTFSELQVHLELPKSSLSRLLQTLSSLQLVEIVGGRYQMGVRILDYYASISRRLDVITIFHQVAEDIGERLDETLQLAQLQGREVVFLAKRDCRRLIRPAAYPGRRVSAHASAVGKAMLARLTHSELERLFPEESLPALTPFTLSTRTALTLELRQVRLEGYAQTLQESTLNLCCFASAILDASGQVVAALSICLATESPSLERFEAATQWVLLGAQNISHALGYRDPDYSLS